MENSLKALIRSLMPRQDNIIAGRVTAVSPLTVEVLGDKKLVVKPLYGVTVADMIASETIKKGSEVLMLSYRDGKKYFVLDKRR